MSTDDGIDADEAKRIQTRYHELAELTGSLAHELKNPLSVISMNMDLLAEDLEDASTPDQRRARNKVDMVRRQCSRLERLLNDYMEFIRLGKLTLRTGNLNDQIDRVLNLYKPQADENSVEIIRYLDPDLPSIKLNSEMMQAALVNLVKNAIEAMPDGGKLVARTRLARGGVALDLIDDGCGMDDSTALKMFDAFFTTKNNQGGSGLGLPMARKIIEAHGGRIGVQSAAGLGTQFTLEFPILARLEPGEASS